eukprot:3544874-Amphidinium_carterae.1
MEAEDKCTNMPQPVLLSENNAEMSKKTLLNTYLYLVSRGDYSTVRGSGDSLIDCISLRHTTH